MNIAGYHIKNASILSPINEVEVAKCPRMSQLNDIVEEGVAVAWKGGIVYTSLDQYRGHM